MTPDVTFCLTSCGEPAEPDCLAAIAADRGGFAFQEVRGLTPAHRALNAMLAQCRTRYLVPLDADMVLRPGYLGRIRAALSDPPGWHTTLFPLWDTRTEEKILALKVFDMSVMGAIPYRDDPCPDIAHYRDMQAAGLACVNLYEQQPIGDHVVRGSFFCYAKYRDLYMVHRAHPQAVLDCHFKGGADLRERASRHLEYFSRRHLETGDDDYRYCVAGMVDGLTAPLSYASKDLGDCTIRVPPDEAAARFRDWHNAPRNRIFL